MPAPARGGPLGSLESTARRAADERLESPAPAIFSENSNAPNMLSVIGQRERRLPIGLAYSASCQSSARLRASEYEE